MAFRRTALRLIGSLSKKYRQFAGQDMALFEILQKEKRSNHVCSEQELHEFLAECRRGTKDFSIELYLRARLLPAFLAHAEEVRIKDLCIIFESQLAT